MSEAVIIALITAGIPTLATAITATIQAKNARRNSAKQSIFQMILEDHIAVQEKHLPTNYQNILDEYDIYHRNGGNSYVTEKVDNYKSWFSLIQAKAMNQKKRKK